MGIALAQAELLARATNQKEQLSQQNQELNIAKQAAEAANKAKGQFFSHHEPRNSYSHECGYWHDKLSY